MDVLIVFDGDLNNGSNGYINSLYKMLEYVPDGINVFITNPSNNVRIKGINIIEVGSCRLKSKAYRLFGSTSFYGTCFNKLIANAIENRQYDYYIFASSSCLQYYKKNLMEGRSLLIQTDLISSACRNYIQNSKDIIHKFYYWKEMLWSKHYEKRNCELFNYIELVNMLEVENANKIYDTTKYIQIPVTYEEPHNVTHDIHDSINLVFIGNMGFKPNRDGITYFYNNYFKKLSGDYILHIIGKDSEKWAFPDPNVKVYGYVEDFNEIMKQMDFGICFMVNGGGMKNKVFDYMRYGIPCLANQYVFKNNYIDSPYLYKVIDLEDIYRAVETEVDHEKVMLSIQNYRADNVAKKFWRIIYGE